MGSERPSPTTPEDAVSSAETNQVPAADKSIHANRVEPAERPAALDLASQPGSAECLLSFDPNAVDGSSVETLLASGRNLAKLTNNLDFRPPERRDSNGASVQTSALSDMGTDGREARPTDRGIGISSIGVSSIPTFFVLKGNNTRESVTPDVEIYESSPLQIHDETGYVLADGGDSGISNDAVKRDPTTGEITSIRYPDGRVRNFTYTGGQLTGIETIEPGADGKPSRSILVKENGRWFAEVGGIRAPLPGDIQFSKNGTLSFDLGKGKWRCEKTDGSVLIEQTIASGARIAFNPDDSIAQVTRPDNSRVQCKHVNGSLVEISEIDKAGNKVTWTKVNDKWISDTRPPQERTEFEVLSNGNVSYVENGEEKVITTTGAEITIKPDGSAFQFDNQGRISAIRHANGLEVYDLKYNDQNRLIEVHMNSKEGNRFHYERQGNRDAWQLTITDESGKVVETREWLGDIRIDNDGTYAFRSDNKDGSDADGFWKVFRTDGTTHYRKENPDGSHAIFDMQKRLVSLKRANDTTLQVAMADKMITHFTTTELNGDQVKYTFDKLTASYIPDNPNYKPILELLANSDGSIEIVDADNSNHRIKLDGTRFVENENNSTAEIDASGRILKTSSKKGDVIRTPRYNYSGTLISVLEERKVGDKIETNEITGSDLSCDINGTIRYTEPGGQKISTTADGSWQSLDDQGRLASVVRGKRRRDFVREADGDVVKILDTRERKDGPKVTEWTRVKENGEWTDSFTRVKSNGETETRRNVTILDDGTYKYINEDGEEKIARVGYSGDLTDFSDNGFSGSVEEARERLTELMESHLDEPQRQRLQIIFDRFEKRAANRIEAQVAAGQDPEKCAQEWDEKVAKSYDNLSKMLDPDLPNATYDLRVRAKLVESMAFTLACPVKANDQGNWGCCWMISGVFCGIIQHPDKMTDMLTQLTNTGQYTDLEGKTWTPPKGLLSITSQGGSWTIENCGNGRRSPVSEILTSVAAYLSEDGRRTDRGSRGGTPSACNHAMKKITGDTFTVTSERYMVESRMRQEMLEKGSYVCIYPGHMYLAALEKHGDDWVVCASLQHGDSGRRINGTVSDLNTWNITGGRRRYNPDINLPECQDSPTGPIGNNWPGGGAGPWGPDGPWPFIPDPWPLFSIEGLTAFTLGMIAEREKRQQREREEEEEEEKKKREEERLKEEQRLLEEREEERKRIEKQNLQEREERKERLRAKRKEAKERRERDLEKRKNRQSHLENEERFKRLKALERAQSLESYNSFVRRSKQDGTSPSNRRSLSTQILDEHSPTTINGLRFMHMPVASEMTNHVELISPVEEVDEHVEETTSSGTLVADSSDLTTPSPETAAPESADSSETPSSSQSTSAPEPTT